MFDIVNHLGKVVIVDDIRRRRFTWSLALPKGARQIAQGYCAVALRGGQSREHYAQQGRAQKNEKDAEMTRMLHRYLRAKFSQCRL